MQASSARTLHTIGRQSQLAILGDIVSRTASQRQGSVVLLAGEAGIGKTRLAHEAEAYAREQGFLILHADGFESDQGVPYAPLLDLFDLWLHTAQPANPVLAPVAPILVKWIPALAGIFPDVPPAAPLEPEQEKQRLFRAMSAVFIQLANTRPLMLVVEDLHWSDNASLGYWLHLIRHAAASSILLLLTYRDEQISPSLNHFLAQLNRQPLAAEISLQRLPRPRVEEMIRALLPNPGGISSEVLEPVCRLSEGNPLLVEELIGALLSAGHLSFVNERWSLAPSAEIQIPRTVQAAVQGRLAGLSKPARQVLDLSAVIGRRFDFGLLEQLTGLDESELVKLIKKLIEAQLVIEESNDKFAFRHALTQQAIYSHILARERSALHATIAQTIQRHALSGGTGPLDEYAGSLAYHFYQAGDWDKALEYARRAGGIARNMYAPQEAIEQFTRALDAAGHLLHPALFHTPSRLEEPLHPGTEPILAGLYHARGQCYELVGEFEKAQADYQQALDSAGAAHDDQGKWQALIDLGFLWAERDYQRTGDFFRQALDLARQMNDPASLAHSLNRLGNWYTNVAELDQALGYHRQALDIFQASNDRVGLAETLDLLGMASQINGDLVQAVAYYQRAVALFRELGDRHGLVSSLATLALCGPSYIHDSSFSPFSLAEAIENGNAALTLARAIGWRSGEIYALHCLSICLGPQGAIQSALELTQLSLEISEEIGHDQWLIGAHCDLGLLYLEVFALSQARQHLELAFKLAQEIGSAVWIGSVTGYLASVCILQGELPRAQALLDAQLTAETPAQTQMQRLCWCAYAELALARQEPDLALAVIDRLIASDPNLAPGVSVPRLSILRSEALSALQRLEQAESELQIGQAAALQQGALACEWRIHLALGRLYQAQAHRSKAQAEFEIVQTMLQALTASIQDQKLRAILVAHTITLLPVPSHNPARREEKQKFAGLTARERQVAALIAQGQSNHAIAETLVVSERTVESHVTNILAKLDFSSRARIAVWAVDKGLADPAR